MRADIVDFIKRELIGPDPVEPHVQENGEEILINEPPRIRYGAGILFPKSASFIQTDTADDGESKILSSQEDNEDNIDDPIQSEESDTPADVSEDFEEEIGLANNYLPSAMGFSCFSRVPSNGFSVRIAAGAYKINDYAYKRKDGETVTRKAYYRIPLDQELYIRKEEIPLEPRTSKDFALKDANNSEISLKFNVRNRTHGGYLDTGIHLLTFTLINQNVSSGENINNEECFFQVSFSVKTPDDEKCFCPYKSTTSKSDKDDEKSNHLLYRHKKTFAVGHGCSPKWNDNDSEYTNSITTEAIPSYELKPVVPNSLGHINLGMYELSDLAENEKTESLDLLNQEYEAWINTQENKANKDLNGELLETASHHIQNCRKCLQRMRNGVELIKSNDKARRAFKLMNRSMLLQQLHYSIHTRNWIVENGNIIGLSHARIDGHSEPVFPDINDKSTWPKNSDGTPKLGSWRPFQIAFVLMNIQGMLDSTDPDRELVDLIWFPTGGGKTEAYLGLSAFTIFFKRLNDTTDSGTTVLMRYTLRLLTSQQFQRAAALICACDKIREENKAELGEARITIGLWVGKSLTPNKRQDARRQFQRLESGQQDENPFTLLKCPWCGAQMGLIKSGRTRQIKGYRRRSIQGHQTIIYKCDNTAECDFSSENYNLPAIVIDEDIYDSPPTLLIGTVDKFAMLTWKPEARFIFGFRENSARKSPPILIIQDELHLISGPLGSMVGLYETLIEELCALNKIKPKIIASTATISRAKEQIHSLYGRGTHNVNVFPAQGLNAGDSFFAYEDENAVGRTYIGIFASALPSHATAQVRILSALLQSIKSISVTDESERDPYWTTLTYFNSIRELGHAATLLRADIREYMNSMWIRKGITGNDRRFINNDIELTSRINNSQIPEYLEELTKSYPQEKYPVDVCLATNMISVGVDISRLGLMAVVGQPKTTSEYIQATSRVGRSKKGSGLVFTIYNCSKPRDRSHFEHFQDYHSKIYSNVEPTSVTPFSAPARERGLHGVMIGLIRFYSEDNRNSPRPFPSNDAIEKIQQMILNRVKSIDGDEYERTEKLIQEQLDYWKRNPPLIYGSFGQLSDIPLMYPAGTNPPEDIKLRAWSTPTSMRNVDSTCEAAVIHDYINIDH